MNGHGNAIKARRRYGSGKDDAVLNYIKSQQWFFGIRADESLLFYSAKRNGAAGYLKKEYGIGFAETLLVPFKKGHPIRVFNLQQAKDFHLISEKKIRKDPRILTSYVRKNDLIYRDIKKCGKKLMRAVKKDDYRGSMKSFNELFCFYEIASAQFIIIFSLGLKLTENKSNLKDIKRVIKKHNTWRNNIAFKEETMGEDLFYFFKFLTKRKKLKLSPLLLMKFLTLNEVEAWLNEKLMDAEIKKIVALRNAHGFVYLNLRSETREVIDDPVEIVKMQKYFFKLDKKSKILKSKNEITGQIAYSSKKQLRGRVIVINDKFELKSKKRLIKGKVLVAIQTTPHYIPYMKKAKAIITDEGGLTCHAAIISREMKIPCIVGAKNATRVLKDGDLVEIGDDSGLVKIIKKN